MKKVKGERFAFHCEQSTAYSIIPTLFEPHEICETREITFLSRSNHVVLRKRSPFVDRFAINWYWIREVGITRKKRRHWEGEFPECFINAHFDNVSLSYIMPLFFLLIFTYLASLGIFVCEIISHILVNNLLRKRN